MPRVPRLVPVLAVAGAALAAAWIAASPASAAGAPSVRVERLSGEPVEAGRVLAIDAKKASFETEAGPVEVPLDDIVEIGLGTAPDPERAASGLEVVVDLWDGTSVRGELRGGGDGIEVQSPLLGIVKVPLDRVASMRFLQRMALAAEPPDLRPSKDGDVIHLAGGDRASGTIESFGAKSLRSLNAQKDAMEIPWERIVAVTLMADDAARPAAPEGALRVALRDGTRVAGTDPALAAGRFRMKGASGFPVDCLLADIVAIQSAGRRFAFLSDLPAEVSVKPVWEVAAGDPAALFAPQFDRSFSGRPLRCGGRTWLDGIGVFSGTTLTWKLDGRFSEFRTTAGIDDGAGPLGGVVFRVLVDGREVWDSGFVRPAGVASGSRGKPSPVAAPRIPLDGAKTLSLVVLAGDAEDPYPVQDEADWLGAIVVRKGP